MAVRTERRSTAIVLTLTAFVTGAHDCAEPPGARARREDITLLPHRANVIPIHLEHAATERAARGDGELYINLGVDAPSTGSPTFTCSLERRRPGSDPLAVAKLYTEDLALDGGVRIACFNDIGALVFVGCQAEEGCSDDLHLVIRYDGEADAQPGTARLMIDVATGTGARDNVDITIGEVVAD